jgi:hypothetical protein
MVGSTRKSWLPNVFLPNHVNQVFCLAITIQKKKKKPKFPSQVTMYTSTYYYLLEQCDYRFALSL